MDTRKNAPKPNEGEGALSRQLLNARSPVCTCARVDEAGEHELTAAIGSLATDWCTRLIPVLSLSFIKTSKNSQE
jgi:hypothetical protein